MRIIIGYSISAGTAAHALRRSALGACAAILAIALSACGPPLTPAQRGRIVFVTNCVACHNPNPNLAGSKGPPIAGSPRELVYDRVLFVKYPPGYKPKRTTHNMRPLPQLKNRIDDLTAFLAEAANKNQPATPGGAVNKSAPPQLSSDGKMAQPENHAPIAPHQAQN